MTESLRYPTSRSCHPARPFEGMRSGRGGSSGVEIHDHPGDISDTTRASLRNRGEIGLCANRFDDRRLSSRRLTEVVDHETDFDEVKARHRCSRSGGERAVCGVDAIREGSGFAVGDDREHSPVSDQKPGARTRVPPCDGDARQRCVR